MRTFAVDVPVADDPDRLWVRYIVKAPTASAAKEMAVVQAEGDDYTVDERTRRVNATWTD